MDFLLLPTHGMDLSVCNKKNCIKSFSEDEVVLERHGIDRRGSKPRTPLADVRHRIAWSLVNERVVGRVDLLISS